jgi:peptidoglycan/LPS O-acetylase OafA/YrhL
MVFILGPALTTLSINEYFKHPWTFEYMRGALSLYEVTKYTVLPGVFMDNHFPQINGPLWTLQYEWTFYFVILILGIAKLLQSQYAVGALFLTALTMTVFHVGGAANVYWTPAFYIPGFFIYFGVGSLAYLYRDQLPMSWWGFLVALIVLLFGWLVGGLGDAAFVFPLGYIVLFVGLSPQIRLSYLTTSGDYSYGLYIWGWPVQQTVAHFLGMRTSVWIQLFLSLSVASMMAILSWHLIEKRMLKLKDVVMSEDSVVTSPASGE